MSDNNFLLLLCFIASAPSIIYLMEVLLIILVSSSDLWVTKETIELGITQHLYICALAEACGFDIKQEIT